MRVLGIDPGSVRTGYGVVEEQATGLQALTWGAVHTNARQSLAMRLKRIYDGLSEAVSTWKPDVVAIEQVFLAENPKTALILGHARGVAILAAANVALPLIEYSALEIKMALVGYGRAAKPQVQHMVQILLRLPAAPQPFDAADALAAAICHLHTQGFQRKVGQ